jgi:sec-independent protein translocase protein TatA
MGLDNPIHIAFLLILLLLVFGAKRLPEMGRSLGDGMRGFKDALSSENLESSVSAQSPVSSQPTVGTQPSLVALEQEPVAVSADVQSSPHPMGEQLPAA